MNELFDSVRAQLSACPTPMVGLVFPDLDEMVYHADPCPSPSISSTMMKTLISPGGAARLRQALDAPREYKQAFAFGTAAHTMALGRGAGCAPIPDQFLTASGALTTRKDAQEELAAWCKQAEADGLTPVRPTEIQQVEDMAQQLLANDYALDLLTAGKGKPEISIFATHETGRWMRARIDLLVDEHTIVDFKTTRHTADDWGFSKTVRDFNYQIQAAHYLAMAENAGLVDGDARFLFIVQETSAPYLVGVHELDADYLQAGFAQREQAIAEFNHAMETGIWEGLPQGVNRISCPTWLLPNIFETNTTIPAPDVTGVLAELEGLL